MVYVFMKLSCSTRAVYRPHLRVDVYKHQWTKRLKQGFWCVFHLLFALAFDISVHRYGYKKIMVQNHLKSQDCFLVLFCNGFMKYIFRWINCLIYKKWWSQFLRPWGCLCVLCKYLNNCHLITCHLINALILSAPVIITHPSVKGHWDLTRSFKDHRDKRQGQINKQKGKTNKHADAYQAAWRFKPAHWKRKPNKRVGNVATRP